MSYAPDTQPDLAGFDAAQRRLRQKLGRVTIFLQWIDEGYPQGTPVDQEGNAFDPTVQPASGGYYASASAVCSVVYQPLTTIRRDEVQSDALGMRSRENKNVIVDPIDYAQSEVIQNATYFEIDGHRWRVTNIQDDSLGPNVLDGTNGPTRYIVYGEDTR